MHIRVFTCCLNFHTEVNILFTLMFVSSRTIDQILSSIDTNKFTLTIAINFNENAYNMQIAK